jgi:HEAT repeat protein
MPDTTQTLIDLLSSEDAHSRSQAALTLGKAADPVALPALIHTLLHDPNLSVHEDAAWAVARYGGPAVEPLLPQLTDTDPTIRLRTAHALGKIGHPDATDPLINALTLPDPEPLVRQKIILALAQLGERHAIIQIIHMLDDEDADVRAAAMDALVQFGKPAAWPLIKTLQESFTQVRQLAAGVLAQIGDPRAVEPLIYALYDSAPEVRLAAIEALISFKDPRAIEPLKGLADDPDDQVRRAARAALQRLTA